MNDLGVPLFLETPICCSQAASASTTHVPSTTGDAGFLSSTSDPDGGRDEGENSGDGELGWGVVLFSGMDLGFVGEGDVVDWVVATQICFIFSPIWGR